MTKHTKDMSTTAAPLNEPSYTFDGISSLYAKPLPASRTGALYSAFSYPTKISPEAIAVFIASHTMPGDTVLDVFGGSGTTGLAVHLCANPTDEVKDLAEKLGAPVQWGPRKGIVYELSTLGAFIADTLCNPPDPKEFRHAADDLLTYCEQEFGHFYAATDDKGQPGKMRHAIWTDVLICAACESEISFWDAVVRLSPLSISSFFKCPRCGYVQETEDAKRVYEDVFDTLLNRHVTRRKRLLARIYGQTGKRKWSRPPTTDDTHLTQTIETSPIPDTVPVVEVQWGDLYRSGYHRGITHLHHFYTPRNLRVLGNIWKSILQQPLHLQSALKMLALSYNSSHSTIMTRVVVKEGQNDFVLTGAQSGVLYVSNLPVEKNIFEGLRRKLATLTKAFEIIYGSASPVKVTESSSTSLDLPNNSVDYIFTDPPFGDYIPYSEINFLNEAWLDRFTKSTEEIIVSSAQGKTVRDYQFLMTRVFSEVSRVLKDDGRATVVFHSARPEIWASLQAAYTEAGLSVEHLSVLDKLQGSFKQVTSEVSVKGDPLLLLRKNVQERNQDKQPTHPDEVLDVLWQSAAQSLDDKERTPERLYSRFIAHYLKLGLPIPMDAHTFYAKANSRLATERKNGKISGTY